MNARFHRSFDHVRIHTDHQAVESARAVNALAYTVGNHVVFGQGQSDHSADAGRRLLAHELTHVVQQQTMSPGLQAKLAIGNPGNAAEKEADRTADAVMSESPSDASKSSAARTKRRFRAAAVSFLSCAPCNPYTDDGLSGPSPPAGELFSPSLFRMKHVVDAELETTDGRTIATGTARLLGSSATVGTSGYCGTTAPATIVSYTPPGAPALITSKTHGEGVQLESHMGTRVDVSTPATLPGAPCGNTGKSPLIPVNHNTFRMRLFADGTKESEFVSNSPFPYHYMYHDTKLWKHNHPATDFEAWALSTGIPLAASLLGFKALRFACCHPTWSAATCGTSCIGGISVPFIPPLMNLPLAAHIANLAMSDCPSPCGNAGVTCAEAKPPEPHGTFGGFGGGRGGGGGSGGKW